MRIVVLATWYPTDEDPVPGVFVEDQAIALSARHEVVVVAPQPLRIRSLASRRVPTGAPRLELRNGIPVVRTSFVVPSSRLAPPRVLWGVYEWNTRRALELAFRRHGPPDILHPHVVFPGGWIAARAGRRYGVPMVLTEHSSPFRVHLEHGAFWRNAAESTLAAADAVVSVSEGLRAQILELTGVDSVVIGNAFDTDLFSPAPGPRVAGPFRFVTVGVLTPRKGIDVLLRACRLMDDAGAVPPWELVIGGDGESRAGLERLAGDLGISDRVRFAGAIDRTGVRDLMRSGDAFVLASRSENLPGVVAEAMLTGLPVVTTRCGAETMVPAEAGVVVEIDDAEAMAVAMADLAGGRGGFDAAVIRAQAVARYGRPAFLDRIDAVYADVLSGKALERR